MTSEGTFPGPPPLSHDLPCGHCGHGPHRFFWCDQPLCHCPPQPPPGFFD